MKKYKAQRIFKFGKTFLEFGPVYVFRGEDFSDIIWKIEKVLKQRFAEDSSKPSWSKYLSKQVLYWDEGCEFGVKITLAD